MCRDREIKNIYKNKYTTYIKIRRDLYIALLKTTNYLKREKKDFNN